MVQRSINIIQIGEQALMFSGNKNLKVDGLTHLNSQKNHISISRSDTVVLSNLHIFAPETSPNTDGIDISNSKNIQVYQSIIATGIVDTLVILFVIISYVQ